MDLLRLLENSDNPLESARKLLAPACMNKLNQYIIDCNDCKTCTNSKRVLARGNPDANILIIAGNATNPAIKHVAINATIKIPLSPDICIILILFFLINLTYNVQKIIFR